MDDIVWDPKRVNRYDSATWISKIFFDWVRKPLWRSYKGLAITDEDLGDAPHSLQANRHEARLQKILKNGNEKKLKLWMVLGRMFIGECIIMSAAMFIKVCIISLIQAYFIGELVASFTTNNEDDDTWRMRYVSSAILISTMLLTSFFHPHINFLSEMLGAKLRITTSTLLFTKLLNVLTAQMKCVNVGQMINIFASDAGKFEDIGRLVSSRLLDPLTTVACLVFLHFTIGLPGVIGLVAITIMSAVSWYFARYFKTIGRKKAKFVDQRLKLTTEMISEARTMKMLCWENVYCDSIHEIRKQELKLSFRNNCCRIMTIVLALISGQIASFITFYILVVMGRPITAQSIYPCMCVFNMMQFHVLAYFQKAMEYSAYALVSFERIMKILTMDEWVKPDHDRKYKGPVTLNNVTSSWYPNLTPLEIEKFHLHPIDLSIPLSGVTMVTGPVGGGKSTLLLTIANEMFIHSGHVKLGGTMTYMPQEPWLFPATIKQNVLFGLPYDEQRYQNIISSVALHQDLMILEKGDQTSVDDKGLTLSGGQKARIALARALYRNSNVYLLDDPLSAVDFRVGRHIWKECFDDTQKTIILVSHSLHLLNDNRFVIYVEKGQVSSGCYGEIKDKLLTGTATDSIDDNCSSVPTSQWETSDEMTLPTRKPSETPTHIEIPYKMNENQILYLCRKAFNRGKGYEVLALVLLMIGIVQSLNTAFNIFTAKWVYSYRQRYLSSNATSNTTNQWTVDLQDLGMIVFFEVVAHVMAYMVFYWLAIRASKQLHQDMLQSVSKTSMTFFDTHHIGRLMNRFSKDIELIDDSIPTSLFNFLNLASLVLGIMAIGIYSNILLLGPSIVCVAVIAFLIKCFIKSVASLKRMEASARSPIYTCMNCTVRGISVIRSHDNQEIVKKEFSSKQDRHSAILFPLKAMGQWLGLICEIAGRLICVAVIGLNLLFPEFTSSSQFGIGLAATIAIGSQLAHTIKLLTDSDHMIVAINRIKEYIDLPAEEGYLGDLKPMDTLWPSLGHIVFKDVTLFYGNERKKALKNISFEIKPGEKIGVVGRTGAGKSSLVAALFRLAQTEGTINIDGADIKSLPLIEYRKKLSIIPQNPVILSGSIRRNLDPLNQFQDAELWDVLESVQLKDVVSKTQKGIDDEMDQFSVGQKQLFCLARTLMNKNRIIVLDEASSNVDNKTDSIIKELIRTKFPESTILAIAHRLQTVMELDRIMVIQSGKLVEFDETIALLKNPQSLFRNMVEKANINIENYLNNQNRHNINCETISTHL